MKLNLNKLDQLQSHLAAELATQYEQYLPTVEHTTRAWVINPATQLKQYLPIGCTGKPKLVLSGSTSNSFSSCERRFHNSRNFLNPRGGPSHAADVGTALHEAWQHWLVTKDVDAGLLRLFTHYPATTDHLPSAKARNLEAAIVTYHDGIGAFTNRLPMEYENLEVATLTTSDGTTVPCTEIIFEIYVEQNVLPEYDVYIAGALDMIMYVPFDELYIVADIKTHRDNKAALVQEKFEFSNQTLPYHLVLSHISQTTTSDFDVLYWASYIDIENPSTQFMSYNKTQRDIEDYLLSFYKLLHRIRQNLDTNHWAKNHNSCTTWGRVCRYKDVCRSTKSNAHLQDMIIGSAMPYERYNAIDLKPHVQLEIDLTQVLGIA